MGGSLVTGNAGDEMLSGHRAGVLRALVLCCMAGRDDAERGGAATGVGSQRVACTAQDCDCELVKPLGSPDFIVRAAWLADVPPAPAAMLLQQTWLAGRTEAR